MQISIGFEDIDSFGLEVSFRELRFDQQGSQFHINFGSVCMSILQWHPSPESEGRHLPVLDTENRFQIGTSKHTGMTEHVHE